MNAFFRGPGQLAAGKFPMSFRRGCQVDEKQWLCLKLGGAW
jgi:hypothetical protein